MKNTNENIDEIKEKLNFIGLDFDNIPEFLKEYNKIEFRTIRENEQRKYKVYKFIDVRDIQIYITPKNRADSFLEKYKLAKKIENYINKFLSMKNPNRELIVNLIDRIDIYEDKRIDVKLSFNNMM